MIAVNGCRGRRWRLLVLAIVVAGLASVGQGETAAARAAGARSLHFGFSDDAANVQAGGNLIARAGGDAARVPFYWPDLEPAPADFHLGRMDAVYNQLLSERITPLFVIYGAPGWARDPELPVASPTGEEPESAPDDIQTPDDMHAWQRLWRMLAARYPAASWQVWNEPNHGTYGGRLGPIEMAALVESAVEAIRSVDREATVLGPATSPGIEYWGEYMAAMYGELGRNLAVAVNLYPRNPRNWRYDFANDLRFALEVAGRRPLWVTEVGLSRAQYGPRRQARGSAWIYRYTSREGVRGTIFHRLAPDPAASDWDLGLAVTDRFEPLAVYRALKRAAG